MLQFALSFFGQDVDTPDILQPTLRVELTPARTLSDDVGCLLAALLDKGTDTPLVLDESNHGVFDVHTLPMWSRLSCENRRSIEDGYMQIVGTLRVHFHQVVTYIKQSSAIDFIEKHNRFYSWLCVNQEECAVLLEDSCSIDAGVLYSSLLRVCSVLERSLRNFLISQAGTCPMMLKDIIKSSFMYEVLGNAIVTLLDVLVGPPTSLNIRNLAWHGFGSESENLGRISCYLLWVAGLIGKKLLDTYDGSIQNQPFQLIELDLITKFDSKVPVFSIVSDHRPHVTAAKEYQIDPVYRLADAGKFGASLMMLLTAFEHSIRVSYCDVNGCPKRQMTAVASEYFTTLDHVFEEVQSDGRPNALFSIIPDRLRTAVYDLLLYPNGLRVRDRLSHMEVSYLEISESLWLYAHNVICAILNVVSTKHEPSDTSDYFITKYVPLYHPLCCLVRLSDTVHNRISSCSIAKPSDIALEDMSVSDDEHGQSALTSLCQNYPRYRVDSDITLDLFSKELGTRNLSIPSQFNQVREWYKFCDSVLTNLMESVKLVKLFAEGRLVLYNTQTLRSRQRKNYLCFLARNGYILETIRALHSIIVIHINQMVNGTCVVTKSERLLIQLSENILALVQQNKWTWCVKYLEQFVGEHFAKK